MNAAGLPPATLSGLGMGVAAATGHALRVVTGGALVVPPFECAWLSGEEHMLAEDGADGGTVIMFEAKGDTDVTIILKASPGARRWQPLLRAGDAAAGASASAGSSAVPRGCVVEPNYTVILGSHRNSCLKFEKSGVDKASVRGVPGAAVSSQGFKRYWLHYSRGRIAVGAGAPSIETMGFRWRDDDPAGYIPGIRYFGLSCWDRHVCYRSVSVLPRALRLPDDLAGYAPGRQPGDGGSPQGVTEPEDGGPLSLLQLCIRSTSQHLLGPPTVCQALAVSEYLRPATQHLYSDCLASLAHSLDEAHRLDRQGLCCLSPPVLSELLQQNDIPLREKTIFDIVADWAAAHTDAAAGHTLADADATQSGSAASGSRSAAGGSPSGSATNAFNANDDGATGGACAPNANADATGACAAASAAGAADAAGNTNANASTNTNANAAADADAGGGSAGSVAGGSSGSVAGDSVAGCSECSTHWEVSHRDDVEADVCEVLSLIRFPLMSVEELHAVLQGGELKGRPSVLSLVEDALGLAPSAPSSPPAGGAGGSGGASPTMPSTMLGAKAALSTARSSQRTSLDAAVTHPWRFTRRSLPGGVELAYVCDGDANGVLRHIGTGYGTQAWMNPMLTRRVDIKASSPTARHTDPRALAGNKFVRHNFAGPRYINGRPVTWWSVDLGSNHQLMVNYYTLRHDGSQDFPRHWVLQGSSDGARWVDLRRHKEDAALRTPGQYASWAVLGPTANQPYRMFRLLLEGPTTSRETPHNFCLSNVELYGYLYRLDKPDVVQQLQQPPQQQQQQQQ